MKKKICKDIFIVALVVFMPFIFFVYNYIPEVESVYLFSKELKSYFFNNIQVFGWLLMTRSYIILILILSYLTVNKNWRIVFIFPLFIETNKVIGLIKNELFNSNRVSILDNSSVLIPLLVLFIAVTYKSNLSNSAKELNIKINNEINSTIYKSYALKPSYYKGIENELKEIRRSKNKLDKTEYLKELIKLKMRFSNTLSK